MYPAELEIKDTTESTTSASYLDLLLSILRDVNLHSSIYDKRDDYNFHITNFPFLRSNIPSSPAYDVFISQLIRYARACSSYECFILKARRLSVSYSNRGTSWNAWNRHLGSFSIDAGILFSNMESPSTWFVPNFRTCAPSWDQIARTCHVFTRLFTSNTPWYFLDFALMKENWNANTSRARYCVWWNRERCDMCTKQSFIFLLIILICVR